MLLKTSTLSSKDGLPNEQIHAISEDGKGRLWLAGPAGAMCYNGHEIRSFDTRDGLECPGLRTIQVHEQDVWIGTDRGIERLQIDGKVRPIDLDFEWKFGIAECFLFVGDDIYVGTSNGLLVLSKAIDSLQLKHHFDIGLVTQLLATDNAVLAICSDSGLVKIEQGEIENFVTCKEGCTPQVLHQTIDKVLLVGTNNGLFSIDANGNTLSTYNRKSGNQSVTAIQTKGSTVFVGFGKTLCTLVREVSQLYDQIAPIDLASRIKDIHIDGYDNIWIATNNSGLIKIPALNNVIHPIENSSLAAAFCITPSENGLLVGGDGFYNDIILKNEKSAQIRDAFEFNSIVWDICEDPNEKGTLWYATEEGLYIKKRGQQPILNTELNLIVRGPNRCLQVRGESIFVGTISGLYKISEHKSCEEILNNQGLSFGYVYSLSLTNNNEFWVATLGQGLWKEIDQTFEQIADENLSPKGNTYTATTNKKGLTLVIQQEKIILLKKDLTTEVILKEYPLGGWTGCWINDETIAIGSSDGICIIDVNKKVIEHRINLFLDRTEWQFTSSRSLIYNHEMNTLFAGLNSGVFSIDLTLLKKYIISPTIHLNQVVLKNTEFSEINGKLTLEKGRWSGQVQAFCSWFVDESTIRYRFKIQGFDNEWTDLSPLNVLHFNSLPAGDYEILGQAFTPLSLFGEIKTLCKLRVEDKKNDPLKKAGNFLKSLRKNSDVQKLETDILIRQNEFYQQELEERKKVERELKNYRVQLEDLVNKRTQELYLEKERAVSADKLKTVFLATMSHEIRTPLGGIIGLNNLMKDTGLTEAQEEYTSKIDFSSQHLLQIINDILDITKIESDSLELEQLEFSIHQLIEEIAELVNLKVGNKIHFLLDKRVQLSKLIIGDPLRIKQVLINLVGNAIKFTHDGHITLKIQQVGSSNNQASILFSVIDTGIGMSKKRQEGLFVPFSQGDTSITRKYGGTGLGLNISEKFVHLMGSKINVLSEENEGSEFSFTLAFKMSETADSNLLKDQFNFNLKSQKIAIIDHYKPSNDLSCELASSYKLKVSSDVVLSKEILAANEIVLINLTTINNKAEVLNLLKEAEMQKYKYKIMLLHDYTETENQIIKSLAQHHITLPLLPNRLVHSVSNLLNNKPDLVKNTADQNKSSVKHLAGDKHVLVAEDNQINQLIIKNVLLNYGFKVTITNNGLECVEALKQNNNFELLFMDIQMPEMDGIEATRVIREELKNSTIPIIALTADVTVETKTKVIDYGMNDYLSKPLILTELEKVINNWVKI